MDSLFTYQPGEIWATFYDPFFELTFQPTFADPEFEAEVNELCGDDIFCLFDVAATGDMDIGLSTLEGGQEIQEITELQIPGLLKQSSTNSIWHTLNPNYSLNFAITCSCLRSTM